jgi:hypothetical protein
MCTNNVPRPQGAGSHAHVRSVQRQQHDTISASLDQHERLKHGGHFFAPARARGSRGSATMATTPASSPAPAPALVAPSPAVVGRTFEQVQFAVPATHDLLANVGWNMKLNVFERATLAVIALQARIYCVEA